MGCLIHPSYDGTILKKYGIDNIFSNRSAMIHKEIDTNYSHIVRRVVKNEIKHIEDKYSIISLGTACFVRYVLAFWGIKKLKDENELSCPFDISVNTTDGVIKMLNDRFKYFFSKKYLSVIDEGRHIHNTYYGSTYIHEQLGVNEFGTGVEIPESSEEMLKRFYIRYSRWIRNFYHYCYGGNFLFFVHHNPDITESQICYLNNVLERFSHKGKQLSDWILICFHNNDSMNFERGRIISKGIIKPSEDFQWHTNSHAKTSLGMEYDLKHVDFTKELILKIIK